MSVNILVKFVSRKWLADSMWGTGKFYSQDFFLGRKHVLHREQKVDRIYSPQSSLNKWPICVDVDERLLCSWPVNEVRMKWPEENILFSRVVFFTLLVYEKENELSFFLFKNCVGLAHHKGVDAVAALNKMWFWVVIFGTMGLCVRYVWVTMKE